MEIVTLLFFAILLTTAIFIAFYIIVRLALSHELEDRDRRKR